MCAIFRFLIIKGHGHEILSISSIANIDKIVNLKHASARQATTLFMISNMQSCHAMIHSQHMLLGFVVHSNQSLPY